MLDGGCHSEHHAIPCLALLFSPFPTLHRSPSLARGCVRACVRVCQWARTGGMGSIVEVRFRLGSWRRAHAVRPNPGAGPVRCLM